MRYTFEQFQKDFPSEEAALDRIMEMRFGKTPECPGCKQPSKFHRITKRRAYACQRCGHHLYPCAGTPFEKSRTSLMKWLFAMYLFTSTRHGVAAKELERQLGVTYKCAWRMAHELRKLMAAADDHRPLEGHVEVDETFIGGVQRLGRRGRSTNKTVVMGMVERDGIVRAGPVPDAKQFTLEPIVLTNVVRGSIVSTDMAHAYNDLSRAPYLHGRVDHSKKEWVRGIHHTNTLEGYWSQLKRGIRGTHVHVSPQHLWKYVSEFSFRYNMRKQPATMFPHLFAALQLPRLTIS